MQNLDVTDPKTGLVERIILEDKDWALILAINDLTDAIRTSTNNEIRRLL